MTCNLAPRPHEKLNTLNGNVWTECATRLPIVPSPQPISSTEAALRNLCGKHLGKDTRAAFENKSMVPAADQESGQEVCGVAAIYFKS